MYLPLFDFLCICCFCIVIKWMMIAHNISFTPSFSHFVSSLLSTGDYSYFRPLFTYVSYFVPYWLYNSFFFFSFDCYEKRVWANAFCVNPAPDTDNFAESITVLGSVLVTRLSVNDQIDSFNCCHPRDVFRRVKSDRHPWRLFYSGYNEFSYSF